MHPPVDWSKPLQLVHPRSDINPDAVFVSPLKCEWVENHNGKRIVAITEFHAFDETGTMEISIANPLGQAYLRNVPERN